MGLLLGICILDGCGSYKREYAGSHEDNIRGFVFAGRPSSSKIIDSNILDARPDNNPDIQIIHMKNGDIIKGRIVSQDIESITIRIDSNNRIIKKKDIEKMQYK